MAGQNTGDGDGEGLFQEQVWRMFQEYSGVSGGKVCVSVFWCLAGAGVWWRLDNVTSRRRDPGQERSHPIGRGGAAAGQWDERRGGAEVVSVSLYLTCQF